MSQCPCGNTSEDGGTLCARCAALQILELPTGATPKQIKQAYHLLVKVWHPDRFQTDATLKLAAEEKLKAINTAYIALTSGNSQPRRSRAKTQSQPATSAVPRDSRFGSMGFGKVLATLVAFGAVQRLAVLACGLSISALLLKFIDVQLASDPSTAHLYADLKSTMARELGSPAEKLRDSIESAFHRSQPVSASVAILTTPAEPATAPDPHPQPASVRSTRKAAIVQLQPFITTGLTRDEVLSIAGPPESSSDDKLTFKGAEIDFKAGQVSGWKIDPAVSSLHVKLWPNPQTDRTLRIFSIDSTKDDVIAVQGTPTTLTADMFAYGNSEIHFRNNRVVSWTDDPASPPLHAIQR